MDSFSAKNTPIEPTNLAEMFVASRWEVGEQTPPGDLEICLRELPPDTSIDQINAAVANSLAEFTTCFGVPAPPTTVRLDPELPPSEFEVSIGGLIRFAGSFETKWFDWWSNFPTSGWGGRAGPPVQDPKQDPPWTPLNQIVRAVEESVWNDPGLLLNTSGPREWLNDLLTESLLSPEYAITIRELAARRLLCPAADAALLPVIRESNGAATSVEQIEQLVSYLLPNKVLIRLGAELSAAVDADSPDSEWHKTLSLMRDGLFYELGIGFGDIKVEKADDLPPAGYRIFVNGLSRASGHILPSEVFVNALPETLAHLNPRAAIQPANGSIGCWVEQAKKPDGYNVWSAGDFLVLQLAACLREAAREFTDLAWTEQILNRANDYIPALVEAVRARFSEARLANVFGRIVSEGLAIRDLPRILERLLEFDELANSELVLDEPDQPGEADWSIDDPVAVAEYLRAGLKDYLTHTYARGAKTLNVYLLNAVTIEEKIHEVITPDDEYSVYRFDEAGRFLRELRSVLAKGAGANPVLLTTNDLRPHLRRLIAAQFPKLPVLSYQELAPDASIFPLDRLTL